MYMYMYIYGCSQPRSCGSLILIMYMYDNFNVPDKSDGIVGGSGEGERERG